MVEPFRLAFYLDFLPGDPSTFWGAVAVTVVGGAILAAGGLGIRYSLSRRKAPGRAAPDAARVFLDNLVTAVGRALMAVRDELRTFEDGVFTDDPNSGQLIESQQGARYEARRTIDETEARVPRVHVAYGLDSRLGKAASETVEALRTTHDHLGRYISQPNWNGWSDEELGLAQEAFKRANEANKRLLRAAR